MGLIYAMIVRWSLTVIAIGALLHFAVTATIQGINLQEAGTILMIIGGAGVLWAIFAAMPPFNQRRDDEP